MQTLISQVQAETAPPGFTAMQGMEDGTSSPYQKQMHSPPLSSPSNGGGGVKRASSHSHHSYYHRKAAPPEFGSPFKSYVHRRASASGPSAQGRSSPTLQLGRSSPSVVAPVHMRVGAAGISGISGSGRAAARGGQRGGGESSGSARGAGAAAAAAAVAAKKGDEGGSFAHQQFARRRSQRLEARTKLIAKLGEAGLTNLGLLLSSSSGR